MKWSKRTLPSETCTAGATTNIDIARDYFIQKMILFVDIQYDTGSSVSKTGTIWDVVSKVELKREGKRSDVFFSLSGNQIYNLTTYDTMKSPQYTDFITTTGQSDQHAYAYVPVDLRIDKWNDRDASALLDSFNYSSLKLALTFGSASTVGTGYTFDSITVYPTLFEAIPEGVADKSAPRYNHVLSFTSFGSIGENQGCDFRTGNLMRRFILITSSNTAINFFEVKSGSANIIPKTHFLTAQEADQEEYGVTKATGYVITDFSEINAVDGALDLLEAKQGDVKLFIYPSSSTASVTVIYDLLEK